MSRYKPNVLTTGKPWGLISIRPNVSRQYRANNLRDMQSALLEYFRASTRYSLSEIEMSIYNQKHTNHPLKTFLGRQIKANQDFVRITVYHHYSKEFFFGSILMVEEETKEMASIFWNSNVRDFVVDKLSIGLGITDDWMIIDSDVMTKEYREEIKNQEEICARLFTFNTSGGLNYHKVQRKGLNHYRVSAYTYKTYKVPIHKRK